MASEETALALSNRLNSNRHQILFQNDSNSGFPRNLSNQRPGAGSDRPAAGSTSNNNGKATRELTGSIDYQHRYYQPEGMYNPRPIGIQNWHSGNGRTSDSPSGDGSEDDEMEGLVNCSDNKNNISSNTSGNSSEKDGNVKLNHLSSFGSSREVLKVGSHVLLGNDLNDAKPSSSENHRHEPSQYPNADALVDRDGELYYSQYLHGAEGLGSGLKDMVVDNGCGFSGRKDVSYSGESGDSLRVILSDPLTGALMDDAMILPCGHSFGGGGMQHVMKMKACYTCSHPVTEGSVAPNLSLRSAVFAFRREEELQIHHASKRRRERLDQDRINYSDLMDTPRGRGLQFPFSVADRVIIKGNKRTPERFVGCEAVVTTQCLNGWYVVKTLDSAESIKLQYRSLAKVSENSSSHPTSCKMTLNRL
ncbi:hypothetical protein L1987_52959 [Smallanthus sonchifolius]|uniref:Uncharacterized protein n=1 Tax=Smallanthus sonchifolius TaxID=185202 RepID=A0ACB9EUJ1_9ASTR|nr:hypothetical protein L1987_52959 [Smallanthus sonchifolius]